MQRLGLILIVLALLTAAGLGALFLKNFVRNPDELLSNARLALREGDYEVAVENMREQLKLTPGRPDARAILFEALVKLGEFDEARGMAEERYKRDRADVLAFGVLCGIALQQQDFAYVSKLAREAAAELPGPAFHVLAVSQDFIGLLSDDWRVRIGAASMMRDGAYLAKTPAERAQALYFSAAVSLEVLPLVPDPEALKDRIRMDVRDALTAVSLVGGDEASGSRTGKRTILAAEGLRGMLGLLSEDEDIIDDSIQSLARFTAGELRLVEAVAALAAHHMGRGDETDALNLARDLQGDYHWYRVLWVARHTKQRVAALRMIEDMPNPHQWIVGMRAVMLAESEVPDERAAGCALLRELLGAEDLSVADAIRICLRLHRHAGRDAAVEAARGTKLAKRSSRFTALLAYFESLKGDDKARCRDLAAQLIAQAGSVVESRQIHALLDKEFRPESAALAFGTLRDLGQGDPASLVARTIRLLREDKGANAEARAQLEIVLRDAAASRQVVAQGFEVAAAMGDYDLAARFLGRALALEGPPRGFDLSVIGFAHAIGPEKSARLGRSLKKIAAETATPAFVAAFAVAVTKTADDVRPVLEALEAASKERASWLPSLILGGRLALRDGDPFNADRFARAVLVKRPSHAAAQEIVGASLMYRRSYREVVELFTSITPASERGYEQLVGAHMMLKQHAAALAEAEAATRAFPDSASAYLTLASVYAAGGKYRDALLALNWAPRKANVQMARAGLLLQLGDHELARSVYEAILTSTEHTHLGAWHGLQRMLTQTNRSADFLAYSGDALDRGLPAALEVPVRQLRGRLITGQGDLMRALPEWERIIKLDPENASALNDAAWNLAITKSKRMREALSYVNRALAIEPNSPMFLDTAAEVHTVIGDYARAMQFLDNALALRPKDVDTYRVHKVRILLAAGRRAQAESLARDLALNSTLATARAEAREIVEKLEAEDRVDAQARIDAQKKQEDPEGAAEETPEDASIPGGG